MLWKIEHTPMAMVQDIMLEYINIYVYIHIPLRAHALHGRGTAFVQCFFIAFEGIPVEQRGHSS